MGCTYPYGVEPHHRLEPGGKEIEQAVALCGAQTGSTAFGIMEASPHLD